MEDKLTPRVRKICRRLTGFDWDWKNLHGRTPVIVGRITLQDVRMHVVCSMFGWKRWS